MSGRWSPGDGDDDSWAGRERAEGESTVRGILSGVVVVLGFAVLVVVLVVLLSGCMNGGAPSPPRGVAPAPPASASGPLDAEFDRWWAEGRHGCGEQTALVVDDLAARAVVEVEGTPTLDARLAAGDYVRRRCPA